MPVRRILVAYMELYVKNRLTSVGADKKQILKTAFV